MPAPKTPNTAAATAAVVRRGQETMARKLRAAGWTVTEDPPAREIWVYSGRDEWAMDCDRCGQSFHYHDDQMAVWLPTINLLAAGHLATCKGPLNSAKQAGQSPEPGTAKCPLCATYDQLDELGKMQLRNAMADRGWL